MNYSNRSSRYNELTCSCSFGLSRPRTFYSITLVTLQRILALNILAYLCALLYIATPSHPRPNPNFPSTSDLKIKSKPSAAYLKARAAIDAHECIWTGEDGTVNGFY
jgi:hypothetical protein